jgi:hypothetical protein
MVVDQCLVFQAAASLFGQYTGCYHEVLMSFGMVCDW